MRNAFVGFWVEALEGIDCCCCCLCLDGVVFMGRRGDVKG